MRLDISVFVAFISAANCEDELLILNSLSSTVVPCDTLTELKPV